jgi:hypothetical protein
MADYRVCIVYYIETVLNLILFVSPQALNLSIHIPDILLSSFLLTAAANHSQLKLPHPIKS